MDLTLEQLHGIALGAVWVRRQEDGIVFSRFTDEQLALYQNAPLEYQSGFGEKATYPAGVKLSFRTDSPSLFLKAEVRKTVGVRRFFSIDVTVDGKYLDSLDNFSHKAPAGRYIDEPYAMGSFEKGFALGPGEKTVCVDLPWSVACVLRQVSLADGATLVPVRPSKKLLSFGDSITQGYDILRPANRQTARLAQMLGAEEFCKAMGGECYYAPLGRLGEDFTPDYIYVAYGTNDWSKQTYGHFRENCRGFFAGLRENYPTAPILVVTPVWRRIWQTEKEFGPFHTVEQGIREAVAPYENVHVIRGFDLVPHDPIYFSDGGLHPNDDGFAHYTENLLKAVKALDLS